MKPNDYLMKKWCFGFGRSKAREEAVNVKGKLQTYQTYPKYRTIVYKVLSAEKKNNQWHVDGVQYASLTAKPKQVKLVLDEKNGVFYAANQKKPWFSIQKPSMITEKGIPPVGSLITVNNKHAIVTAVDRNQLTVFAGGQIKTIVCKPGTIRWHSDKVLLSAVKGS